MSSSSDLSLEELQQFSYRLAIPSFLTLLVNFFGWTTAGQIVTVIIHIIVLGSFFMLFKELKSVFLKFILSGLVLCLAGEILIFFNLENDQYTTSYWAYLGIHCARNLAFGGACGWNILKSPVFNPLWSKLIPYFIMVPIFLILQLFVFSLETSWKAIFIVYNVTLCAMVLAAALRFNHTNDKSYFIIIVAVSLFMLSEVFYFWEFSAATYDPLTHEKEDSILNAFRAPLMQLGSVLIVCGAVDHIIFKKLTTKPKEEFDLEAIKESFLRNTKKRNTTKTSKTPRGGDNMGPSVLNTLIQAGKKNFPEALL